MSYAFAYDNPLFRRCDYKMSAIAPKAKRIGRGKGIR
jgi:hypothetical protein